MILNREKDFDDLLQAPPRCCLIPVRVGFCSNQALDNDDDDDDGGGGGGGGGGDDDDGGGGGVDDDGGYTYSDYSDDYCNHNSNDC